MFGVFYISPMNRASHAQHIDVTSLKASGEMNAVKGELVSFAFVLLFDPD